MKRFLIQVLLALDRAYSCGAVHTGTSTNSFLERLLTRFADIKPDNIMIPSVGGGGGGEHAISTWIRDTELPGDIYLLPTNPA